MLYVPLVVSPLDLISINTMLIHFQRIGTLESLEPFWYVSLNPRDQVVGSVACDD